jgi:hypothetical protein
MSGTRGDHTTLTDRISSGVTWERWSVRCLDQMSFN